MIIFDRQPPGEFMLTRRRSWSVARWAVLMLAVSLIGSGIHYAGLLKSAFARNPVPRTADSIARGRQLFQKQCAVCHGELGHGDGVAAASLVTRPEDLGKIAGPPIFPDGVVVYRIANGKNAMPAFKETLSDMQLWDLLNFIRSLARA